MDYRLDGGKQPAGAMASSFSLGELNIPAVEVVKILHGGTLDVSHQFYVDLLKEELAGLQACRGICGGYVEINSFHCEVQQRLICIGELKFSVGEIIFNELKRAEKIVVFACTAGKEICDYIKVLYSDDPVRGFLVESMTNVLVETAMDKIQEAMQERFSPGGLLVSNRYSPGYCNWNVSEQHQLFQLLPLGFCGISVSEFALMSPVKSISGFIGVGKDIRYNHYKCKTCTQRECIYRK